MLKRSLKLILIVAIFSVASCGPKAKPIDLGQSHYKMAQSHIAVDDYTNALDEMLQAVKYKPNDPDYQSMLGEIYLEKKAYNLSEQHYKKALKLKPNDPMIQNNLAALYLTMKRWDDAARLFRQVADNLLFRYQSRALIGLGVANYHGGAPLKAVMAFKEAIEVDSRNASALFLLSKTYYSLGKYDLTLKYLQQALTLEADNIDFRLLLGQTLLQRGQNEAAAIEFREVANRADGTERGMQAREYLELLGEGT